MTAMSIRGRLKSGLKKVFGMDEPLARAAAPARARPRPAPAPTLAPTGTPLPAPLPPAAAAAVDSAEPADVAPVAVDVADVPADASTDEATPSAPAEATADAGPDDGTCSFTFEAVQEILNDMVRPALQADGGDITLIRVQDELIYVKLVGACSTCPSSIMTMKMGVELLLKEEFPTVKDVIQVES